MTSRNTKGSGGLVERAIFFLAGCIMGVLGGVLLWFCYKWSVSNTAMDHRLLWIIAAGGLAFFMLRGAWFTVIPKRKQHVFELETTRGSSEY